MGRGWETTWTRHDWRSGGRPQPQSSGSLRWASPMSSPRVTRRLRTRLPSHGSRWVRTTKSHPGSRASLLTETRRESRPPGWRSARPAMVPAGARAVSDRRLRRHGDRTRGRRRRHGRRLLQLRVARPPADRLLPGQEVVHLADASRAPAPSASTSSAPTRSTSAGGSRPGSRTSSTGVDFRVADSGSPVLAGAVAWIDCDIEFVHEAGDHFIVLGRVRALDIEDPSLPLLFFQGGYGRFAPLSLAAGDPRGLAHRAAAPGRPGAAGHGASSPRRSRARAATPSPCRTESW